MTTYTTKLIRRSSIMLLIGILIGITTTVAPAAHRNTASEEVSAQQPHATSQKLSAADIDDLIAQMTLDEKLSFLHGATDSEGVCQGAAGFMPGVERLGIPDLCLSDGPAGVRGNFQATALPAPVMLASTFDPDIAYKYGQVIGSEGRAYNQDVLLSPMVNIVRVPYAGRNFETFGEDPLLASGLVEGEIKGLQDEGLIATIKHYAANNQEDNRTNINAIVDEKTLREIYLPGFEAAIKAGAGAVMCAYNAVNGTYACENSELLTKTLRDEWGFTGWVMTDWGANHPSGINALTAGLDQEMSGENAFGAALKAAVADGTIQESAVDQSVRRILTSMNDVGLLSGNDANRPNIDDIKDADADVARDVAMAGAVLMRNENEALPLKSSEFSADSDLLIVGPGAADPLAGGGGSSSVRAFYTTNLLSELDKRSVPYTYLTGIDTEGVLVPETNLGLTETISNFTTISYTDTNSLPSTTGTYTWTGTLTVTDAGDYSFHAHIPSGTAVGALTIDGSQVMSISRFSFGGTAEDTFSGDVALSAGTHTFTLTVGALRFGSYVFPTGELELWLGWTTPAAKAANTAALKAAIGASKATVVFGQAAGSEGSDREITLDSAQEDMIQTVVDTSSRSIVVLNIPSTILMPWASSADAILNIWLPGQEGGAVTAALLLGEENPSGKLPITFPVNESDWATYGDSEMYPGVAVSGQAYGYQQEYKEGTYVGYRSFDKRGKAPLFPFGHGLSYTTFAYSDIKMQSDGTGIHVTFSISNTGQVTGTEVPQVYVGPASSASIAAFDSSAPHEKDLAGFARVTLAPGQATTISIYVKARQLSSWNTSTDAWAVDTGTRPFYIGSSSRDIRLTSSYNVSGLSENGSTLYLPIVNSR